MSPSHSGFRPLPSCLMLLTVCGLGCDCGNGGGEDAVEGVRRQIYSIMMIRVVWLKSRKRCGAEHNRATACNRRRPRVRHCVLPERRCRRRGSILSSGWFLSGAREGGIASADGSSSFLPDAATFPNPHNCLRESIDQCQPLPIVDLTSTHQPVMGQGTAPACIAIDCLGTGCGIEKSLEFLCARACTKIRPENRCFSRSTSPGGLPRAFPSRQTPHKPSNNPNTQSALGHRGGLD